MTGERAAETLVTGAWLGLAQVALAFSVMASAGAAAILFFVLSAFWIAGSTSGVLGARGPRITTGVLVTALVLVALGRWMLAAMPLSGAALAVGLVAAFVTGAYAGAFLRDRSRAWGEVRALLFHENTGFVAGYALGAGLLLSNALALDIALLVAGLAVLAWRCASMASRR